ncbi:MAG: glycoside hydrolase family 1 protein [Chloroflexi bacterium]|nr:glycoside hydrolase family 1 protein [Chloroflexota bacterium]
MSELRYPPGFLWGTATSAHQVEGGNENNDWGEWEKVPGNIKTGPSGLACDHLHRYREDFDLAKELGTNAHRMSIEWSRIEPQQGQWDGEAIEHYRQVLLALRERGIEPFVTLHHFTNPLWLARDGGWESEQIVERFAHYTAKIVQELGDLVRFWITLNEPTIYVYSGYVSGAWPPQQKDFALGAKVLANMLRAHAAAYNVIHKHRPDAQVGIAHAMSWYAPYHAWSPLDILAARLWDRIANWSVFNALTAGRLSLPYGLGSEIPEAAGSMDFVGLNYYYRQRLIFDLGKPKDLFSRIVPAPWAADAPTWVGEIYPDGLYRILKALATLAKPIYITENGVVDEKDQLRPKFILDHLTALHRAISEGIPVLGYFHWSLLDNFEWAEGTSARFGLVHVDFSTQKRTIKQSGRLYAEICKANAITSGLFERFAHESAKQHLEAQTV